jgi:uncharacterized membrane protein
VSKPKTSERGRKVPVPVAPAPTRRRPVARRARPRPRADGRAPAAVAPGTPWRSIATTVISLLGLAVASYLTYEHYTGSLGLTCPLGGGAINCLAVTTSKESVVFGVPVAVLGLLFFAPMLVLSLPWAWRTPHRYVAPARLAMSVVGIGFVFYLVYAELFEIRAICLWCTSVHVLTFLTFVIVATGWEDATTAFDAAA